MLKTLTTIILLCCSHAAYALNIDVGMLTLIDGNVEVVSNKGAIQPAGAFLKVALGDKLVLRGNARAQVVYFESSLQETWNGAGEVHVGQDKGTSGTLQATVRKLPPLVSRQLVKTPASGQHGKVGMVTVRSLSSDTVESLEKQYTEFRAASASNDTTPEVFLLTGLLEMEEYEHAEKTLSGFRSRLEITPALAAVVEHFEPLIKAGAAERAP